MDELSLKIITVGSRKVPNGWHISRRTKIQRIYYIKGGKDVNSTLPIFVSCLSL